MIDFLFVPKRLTIYSALALIAITFLSVIGIFIYSLTYGNAHLGPGFHILVQISVVSMGLLLLVLALAALVENEFRRRHRHEGYVGLTRFGPSVNQSYLWSQFFALLYFAISIWLFTWML